MWTYDNINLNPVPNGTIALYTEIAGKFKRWGIPVWQLLLVCAIRSPTWMSIRKRWREPAWYDSTVYTEAHIFGEKADTMEEYVNSFRLPDENDGRTLTGIFIDLLSHDPHGSHFTTTGHSPKLLEIYMKQGSATIHALVHIQGNYRSKRLGMGGMRPRLDSQYAGWVWLSGGHPKNGT